MSELFRRSYFYLLVLPLFIFISCSDDDVVEPETLYVETSLEGVTSQSTVRGALDLLNFEGLGEFATYDFETFYMTYRTTFQGEPVIASGLIALPNTSDPVSLLAMQHGTIAAHREAPTLNSEDYLLFLAAASFGYVVVLPDFIGFGTTSDILHPYYDEASSASVVRDMLLAGQQYAQDNDFNLDGELYLAGYSQGGYVTFAAQKLIEEKPIEGISLVASAPAAGGYDIISVKDFFFAQEVYEQPFFISYVIHNYNTHYEWGQPLEDFFQQPYADRIPGLHDGSNSGGQINGQLTTIVADLLQPEILNEFDTNPNFANLKSAMIDNSLVDWAPQTSTRLYHGTADVTVPFESSVVSFEKLTENGARDLEFIEIEGGTHGSSVVPYLELTLNWFVELRNN